MHIPASRLRPGLPAQANSIALPQNKLSGYRFREAVQNAYRFGEYTGALAFLERLHPVQGIMKADEQPRADFLEKNVPLFALTSEGRIV
jgi:hypothetical protein